MDLTKEIEARQTRRDELREELERVEHELEQLQRAFDLVANALNLGKPMNPSPRAAKEKPVRAEKPAPAKPARQLRTKPGDTHFARCGHERSKENVTAQNKCRTCKNAAQLAYLAKKSGKSPKAKAEPDPVSAIAAATKVDKLAAVKAETPPGCCVACDEPLPPEPNRKEPNRKGRARIVHDDPECIATYHAMYNADRAGPDSEMRVRRAPLATVEAVLPVTAKAAGLVLNADERERLLKAAQKWKGQCSALNDRGQRCGLLHPHEGPHNSSGRFFTVAFSAGSALPRRELDEAALGSRQ